MRQKLGPLVKDSGTSPPFFSRFGFTAESIRLMKFYLGIHSIEAGLGKGGKAQRVMVVAQES